jgi:hypothetical protein
MISIETATDIAFAYREIATAEKLLQDVKQVRESRGAVDIRDAFGRRQNGLQLGVPSGENSRTLFNVPWAIAIPVIETHIAAQKGKLAILNEKAMIEAEQPEQPVKAGEE